VIGRGRAATLTTALVAMLLAAACSTVPPATGPEGRETLSGRLAVRIDARNGEPERSVSVSFELEGDDRTGRLNLTSPLGSRLAEARWAPGSVVLATPRGERQFANLDDLAREVLGESVPVAALFDWLQGRPWPGAPSAPNVAPAEPGFEQLGWVVSLARFDDASIAARRERPPAVTLRAKLDRP
jgi:outer membrane lipoprotein LolB